MKRKKSVRCFWQKIEIEEKEEDWENKLIYRRFMRLYSATFVFPNVLLAISSRFLTQRKTTNLSDTRNKKTCIIPLIKYRQKMSINSMYTSFIYTYILFTTKNLQRTYKSAKRWSLIFHRTRGLVFKVLVFFFFFLIF